MNTWTAHHPCPVTDCPGELVIEYEAGRHAEDFFAMLDDVICEHGHVTPTVRYWDRDADAYNEMMQGKYEEARETYYQGREERY